MTPTLDERDEALEQALHFIQQSAERWHNRLTYKNLRLAERYLEDKLEFWVLLKELGVGTKKWCIRFNRIPLGRPDEDREGGQVLCSLAGSEQHLGSVEAERPVGGADRDEQAVLVDHVQVVDQPEAFSVPTQVRLEVVERLPELLRGSLYLSAYKGLQFGGLGDAVAAHDGEHSLLAWIWDGGVGEVVEAGPDGVDRVAQDERYRVGDRGRIAPDLDHAFPRLRVVLGDEWVGIGPMEGDDLRFEVIDVLFRTVELQPGVIEPAGHAVTFS